MSIPNKISWKISNISQTAKAPRGKTLPFQIKPYQNQYIVLRATTPLIDPDIKHNRYYPSFCASD